MRIGFDSYSFHRLFGDVRPGEIASVREPFRRGGLDVLTYAHRLDVAVLSLQTCFLAPLPSINVEELRGALGDIEPVLAWGHPDGLRFGEPGNAFNELCEWIKIAPMIGCQVVRLVAGNHQTNRHGKSLDFLASTLSRIAELARAEGVVLALENHADLDSFELRKLLELVDDSVLGICFDTANALRVGDDPLEATTRLLPHIKMVHLKDVAPGAYEASVGPRSVTYGSGVIPVRGVLRSLAHAGFEGPMLVELGYLGPDLVDELVLLEECLAWLKDTVKSEAVDARRVPPRD